MLGSFFSGLRAQITWMRVCILFLLSLLVLAGFCFYLDHRVREEFEGKRFALPARVYARPLELFEGLQLEPRQLRAELNMLGYARLQNPTAAGEYWQQSNGFVISVRPFDFWDGAQEGQLLRVQFKDGLLVELTDVNSGMPVDLARLDPVPIGGIYPGQNEDRQLIRLEQAPRHLIDALLAVEDQRFYSHYGVDPRGIARALVSVVSGDHIQGGSTLTQQLVKNFFLTPDRTIRRKATEMLMALLLELHYEKDDILETYLNEVYFGQDRRRAIHGFGLASQFYFNRSIEQLELHQSALLVGMLKGPSSYNPRHNPERALERRNLVLSEMFRQGAIVQRDYQTAVDQPLDVSATPNLGLSLYPAFLDLVLQQLTRDYDEDDLRSEGLRIFTTLDPIVQQAAEQALISRLQALEQSRQLPENLLEGAVIVTDVQTAEVQAVVGGRDPRYDGFNRALKAERQIGSLLKPAIYLTALENPQRYSLATLLDDSELAWEEPGIETWEPHNYDNQFHGDVPLWLALAKSYNVAAVRLGLELGLDNVLSTTHRLGIQQPLPEFASTLLGTVNLTPLAMTQMYQTIATGGFRMPLRAIREVLTADGEPLRRYGLHVEQTVKPAPAHLLIAALQQVVENGTGRNLSRYLPPGIHAAGKTGTTDGLRDSWFAGFTGDRVAVVWVGNDANQSTGLTGSSGAMTVWGTLMADLNPRPLIHPQPETMVSVATDRITGARVSESCENALELPFIAGSAPLDEVACGGTGSPGGKIKGWFGRLFGSN